MGAAGRQSGPPAVDKQRGDLPGHLARAVGNVVPAVTESDPSTQQGKVVPLHVPKSPGDVDPSIQLDDRGELLIEQVAERSAISAARLTDGPGQSVGTFDIP